jgi:CheY-like chemotaxis protein
MKQSQIRILVLDDGIDTTHRTAELLNHWGFGVTSRPSAATALKSILRTRPDVVVLDLTQPHLNGFRLAKLLNKFPGYRTIPLIAISSCFNRVDRAQAREVGINHYLRKPANPDYLKKLIERETYISDSGVFGVVRMNYPILDITDANTIETLRKYSRPSRHEETVYERTVVKIRSYEQAEVNR